MVAGNSRAWTARRRSCRFPQAIFRRAGLRTRNRVRAGARIGCARPCKKCRVFTSRQPRRVYCRQVLAFSPQEPDRPTRMMQTLIDRIERLDERVLEGRITALNGLLVEAEGPKAGLSLGAHATIETGQGVAECEIVGFRGETALMMPFGSAGRGSPWRAGAASARSGTGAAVRRLARPGARRFRPAPSTTARRLPRARFPTRSRAIRPAPTRAPGLAAGWIWASGFSMPSSPCGAVSASASLPAPVSASRC